MSYNRVLKVSPHSPLKLVLLSLMSLRMPFSDQFTYINNYVIM